MLGCYRREVDKLEQAMKSDYVWYPWVPSSQFPSKYIYATTFFCAFVNSPNFQAVRRSPWPRLGSSFLLRLHWPKGLVQGCPWSGWVNLYKSPHQSFWLEDGLFIPLDTNSIGRSLELMANIIHTPWRKPIHSSRKIKVFIMPYLHKPMNSCFCLKLVWIRFLLLLFCSVAQSCPALCDHKDCSTPGLPVYHQLPELTQTHVHWVGDAIQPYHFCNPLLLPPSIFPSIRVFSNESVLCIRWPKYWSFSFSISPSNEYSGLISFRMDWLELLAVRRALKSLLQHHSSKASILWRSAFFTVQLSHLYMTTGKTIALTFCCLQL